MTTPLLLAHPTRAWMLDLTAMNLRADQLDALAWPQVFAAMASLEAGAIANPDEGRMVGHYWLRAPELAPTVAIAKAIGESVDAVLSFAEAVHRGTLAAEDGLPFTDLIHVGIGGSALGPQLLVDALQAPGEGLRVHFVDNTDPDGIARLVKRLGDRLRHTLVHVVSKSGATPETANGLALVERALRLKGYHAPAHLVATTQAGSALHQRAVAEGWLRTFPLWDWAGGRTSMLAAVGLVPASLAGIDVQRLLAGAREMDAWTRHATWQTNPAAMIAGAWYVAGGGKGDRAMVTLPYADRLVLLSRYLQQLIMESIGKEHDLRGEVVHQGLTVYGNKGSTDQHAYVQQLRDGRDDFFACFIQVLDDGDGSGVPVEGLASAGDFLQGFLLGTRRALRERNRPSFTLTIPTIDAYELGALIALWERTVGHYASLIGVNAYHQPGVEAGKRAARDVLTLSERVQTALSADAITADALALALDADAIEVRYLLERLAATGRAARHLGESLTFTRD